LRYNNDDAAYQYGLLLERGVSKEMARMVLPMNTYTEWFWRMDLHNLLHFLTLRTDSHAQREIRVYADAMVQQLTDRYPVIMGIWSEDRDL
jgi:thymidylate synthase (FAD)